MPSPMSAPIRLTDRQLDVVIAAAEPLPVADREIFLRDIAAALRGHPEIGNGVLHRAIAEVQRRYWRPEPEGVPSRWAR